MSTQPKPIPVKSVIGEAITQQLEVHVGVLMLWPCSRLQPATINLTIPASSTYRVTPDDHTSTLNPGKVSRPLAISGGWNAGDPWLVRQVSSTANVSRAWWKHPNMWSYYYITVQEIQSLMKTSEHVKLLLYHSTRNSGPDENIRTREVINISQYKKFRAWWKPPNTWSYYYITVQEIQGLMKTSEHVKLRLYIYHSTTRNYICIMKNSNTQLLLRKVHWDSCIFPEHY